MTLREAKSIARQAIKSLGGVDPDNIMDDGHDSNDEAQQRRFCSSSGDVNYWHKELANIDIDRISKEKMDSAWYSAWGGASCTHLPEVRINHAIKYAEWILSLHR